MKTETIWCDICGYKFPADGYYGIHWNEAPASLDFNFQSPPHQIYESRHFDHVCYKCSKELKIAIYRTITERKGKSVD